MRRSLLQQKIELVLFLLPVRIRASSNATVFSCVPLHVCVPQCLPHSGSSLNLKLATWVTAAFLPFLLRSALPLPSC